MKVVITVCNGWVSKSLLNWPALWTNANNKKMCYKLSLHPYIFLMCSTRAILPDRWWSLISCTHLNLLMHAGNPSFSPCLNLKNCNLLMRSDNAAACFESWKFGMISESLGCSLWWQTRHWLGHIPILPGIQLDFKCQWQCTVKGQVWQTCACCLQTCFDAACSSWRLARLLFFLPNPTQSLLLFPLVSTVLQHALM